MAHPVTERLTDFEKVSPYTDLTAGNAKYQLIGRVINILKRLEFFRC